MFNNLIKKVMDAIKELITNADKKVLLQVAKQACLFRGMGLIALRGSDVETVREIVLKEYDNKQKFNDAKLKADLESSVSKLPKPVGSVQRELVSEIKKSSNKLKSSKMYTIKTGVKSAPKSKKQVANAPKKEVKNSKNQVAANAPKNEKVMVKSVEISNEKRMEMVNKIINAEMESLKGLALWDDRFASVDFSNELTVKGQFMDLLYGAQPKTTKAPVRQAANDVEAPVKKRATKSAAKAKKVNGKKSKAEIMIDFGVEASKSKNEDDQWVSLDELTDEVEKTYPDEFKATRLGAGSLYGSKLPARGYEIEKRDDIFKDENGKAVIVYRIVSIPSK